MLVPLTLLLFWSNLLANFESRLTFIQKNNERKFVPDILKSNSNEFHIPKRPLNINGIPQVVHTLQIVRETIGENGILMIDANQNWDVEEAVQWVKTLTPSRIYWIEEPTAPDDVIGHLPIYSLQSNQR